MSVHMSMHMSLSIHMFMHMSTHHVPKLQADRPEDDEPLRKKLWLRIAKHVIGERKDIKKGIDFLTQSELLKIEDILPFFPDFVLIDDFKLEICASLEEYNRHIEDLKTGMVESTRSADLIRKDIRALRNRRGFVHPVQVFVDMCADMFVQTCVWTYVWTCVWTCV